jgi:DDE superfamily endonuclease
MRIHLPLPPRPRRAMRAESEYHRYGTRAYLAAYDVHRARVLGRCEPSTGIKPFTALVDQVMSAEPYASAKRVFWVVDNGASHRNWAAADRLSSAYPNAQMVHLPVHASWLNQVEVYFSVIQRKLLTPGRLRGPRRACCPDPRLRGALQRRRQAIRLEVHPHRPRPAPSPHREPRPARPTSAGRMIPDELTGATTGAACRWVQAITCPASPRTL